MRRLDGADLAGQGERASIYHTRPMVELSPCQTKYLTLQAGHKWSSSYSG